MANEDETGGEENNGTAIKFDLKEIPSRDSATSVQFKSVSDSRIVDKSPSMIMKATESLRNVAAYTMTGFFDFNPSYLLQFRGLMNILQLILSLIVVILLGTACQLRTIEDAMSDGFFCKPPETFLFVTACSSFFTSFLYLFCCLLSKKTESLLFDTSLEVSYFIMYSVLLMIATIALLVSGFSLDMGRMTNSYNSRVIYAAAAVGLINGILYGASAVVFFISHDYVANSETVVNAF